MADATATNQASTAGISATENAGGGGAHQNVQPSIVANFIVFTGV